MSINYIIDFGKFKLFPNTTSNELEAYLVEHRYSYEWSGTFNTKLNRHTKETYGVNSPILVNGILCGGCKIFIENERYIDKISFTLTEFSKNKTSAVAKMLNEKLHTTIPELKRDKFLKLLPYIWITPFGQVVINKNKEQDEIVIELYFREVCSQYKSHTITPDFGPDRLSEGRIYLNQAEVNGEEKISSIMQRLQDNSQRFIYVDKCFDEAINKAVPLKDKSAPVITIKECGWIDEVFNANIDYSEADGCVKSIWLYKKAEPEEEAEKVYEKIVAKVKGCPGIAEYHKDKPAYIATRFYSKKCKNFLIEVARTDDTVRVAFLYNFVGF